MKKPTRRLGHGLFGVQEALGSSRLTTAAGPHSAVHHRVLWAAPGTISMITLIWGTWTHPPCTPVLEGVCVPGPRIFGGDQSNSCSSPRKTATATERQRPLPGVRASSEAGPAVPGSLGSATCQLGTRTRQPAHAECTTGGPQAKPRPDGELAGAGGSHWEGSERCPSAKEPLPSPALSRLLEVAEGLAEGEEEPDARNPG